MEIQRLRLKGTLRVGCPAFQPSPTHPDLEKDSIELLLFVMHNKVVGPPFSVFAHEFAVYWYTTLKRQTGPNKMRAAILVG